MRRHGQNGDRCKGQDGDSESSNSGIEVSPSIMNFRVVD